MRRKKVERKEKPSRFDYIVVREDDARVSKYLTPLEGTREVYGVSIEHARRLSMPVAGQPAYVPLEIPVWQYVRAATEPVPVAEAHELYRTYVSSKEEEEV